MNTNYPDSQFESKVLDFTLMAFNILNKLLLYTAAKCVTASQICGVTKEVENIIEKAKYDKINNDSRVENIINILWDAVDLFVA